MSNSSDLKLPKIPVVVGLLLEGADKLEVEIFVAQHHARYYERQSVIDLLEDEASFLPARHIDQNQWLLFNKSTVVWIEVPLRNGNLPVEEMPDTLEHELYDIRKRVAVEMAARQIIEGHVLYSAPPTHARLVDYLNQAGRFFRVWTEDTVYLVNKNRVLHVKDFGDHP